MIQHFTIPGKFCSLNEYLDMHYQLRAKTKRESDDVVAWAAKAARIKKRERSVEVSIKWYEQNRRRDIDNVQFAVKFILDGLVKAGILHGDSPTYVRRITHEVAYDQRNPRIEVTLID